MPYPTRRVSLWAKPSLLRWEIKPMNCSRTEWVAHVQYKRQSTRATRRMPVEVCRSNEPRHNSQEVCRRKRATILHPLTLGFRNTFLGFWMGILSSPRHMSVTECFWNEGSTPRVALVRCRHQDARPPVPPWLHPLLHHLLDGVPVCSSDAIGIKRRRGEPHA